MTTMPRPPPWLSLCTLACTFDASGQGEAPRPDTAASSTQGTSSSSSSSSGAPTSSAGASGSVGGTQSTGEPVLTDATSSSGPGASSSSTATSEPPGTSTTDAPDVCQGLLVKEIELVDGALVEAPMTTLVSESGEGLVAFSGVADSGTVTFTFDLPCPGTYLVWGRVLDMWPDVHDSYDPDSFYVQADGGPEAGWFYGCQTADKPGYRWLRIRPGAEGAPCDSFEPWVLDLSAGLHTLRLRNREWESGGRVAVVARVLLVNDPDYLPTMTD